MLTGKMASNFQTGHHMPSVAVDDVKLSRTFKCEQQKKDKVQIDTLDNWMEKGTAVE